MNHAHPHPAAVLRDLLNPAISILDMADKYRLTLTQLWRLIDSQPFHEHREAFQALSRTRTDIVDQDADARIRSALMSVAALPTDADRPTAESARLAASKLATYQRARRNQQPHSPAPPSDESPPTPTTSPAEAQAGCLAYALRKQDPAPSPPETAQAPSPAPSSHPLPIPQTTTPTQQAQANAPCPAPIPAAEQAPPTPQQRALAHALRDTLATNIVAAAGRPHAARPRPPLPENPVPVILPDPFIHLRKILNTADQQSLLCSSNFHPPNQRKREQQCSAQPP